MSLLRRAGALPADPGPAPVPAPGPVPAPLPLPVPAPQVQAPTQVERVEVGRVNAAIAALTHVDVPEDAAADLRAEAYARDALRIAEDGLATLQAVAAGSVNAFVTSPSYAGLLAATDAHRQADTAPAVVDAVARFARSAAAQVAAGGPARACASSLVQGLEMDLQVLLGEVRPPAAVVLDKARQLERTTSEDLEALAAWSEWSKAAQDAVDQAAALRQAAPLHALVVCDRLIGDDMPALRALGEVTDDAARRADRSRQVHKLPMAPVNVGDVDTRAAIRPVQQYDDPVAYRQQLAAASRPGMTAVGPFAADMPFQGPAR